MKRFQFIISAVLVIGLLFAGLPQFCPEDADQNTRVDLGDAIQQVRNLIQSVNNPENFSGSFGRAISTLTVLAGIKTVIKTDSKANVSATGNLLNIPFLISKIYLIKNSEQFVKIAAVSISYQSIDYTPDCPPSPDNSSSRMLMRGFSSLKTVEPMRYPTYGRAVLRGGRYDISVPMAA